jgi:hypothetical protein
MYRTTAQIAADREAMRALSETLAEAFAPAVALSEALTAIVGPIYRVELTEDEIEDVECDYDERIRTCDDCGAEFFTAADTTDRCCAHCAVDWVDEDWRYDLTREEG